MSTPKQPSTLSAEHAHPEQDKAVPSADYIENYAGLSGHSKNFAAIAEAKGFKPDDGRLVVDPAEARVEYGDEVGAS